MSDRTEQRERRRRKRVKDEKRQRRRQLLSHVSAEPGTMKPMTSSTAVASEPIAAADDEKDSLIVEAAADGKSVKIKLYGVIGGWSGVSAGEFSNALEDAGNKDIALHINSGGGSVFAAVAIYNMLAALKQNVTVIVEGVAASAATLIAMAGDDIRMAENAFWMVHKARGSIYGTAEDMRNYIELLEKANNSLLLTYAARTGIARAEIEQVTSKDTWMSAAEAKAGGWIDSVIEAKKVKPHVAPKSEAVTAEKYDAEHYREFTEHVDTLAANVGFQELEPVASTGKPLEEAHAMKKKFSEWLTANGFDSGEQTETQLKALRIAWRAECGADAPDDVQSVVVSDDPDDEWRRKAAARYRKQAAIEGKLGSYPELAAKAIEENWDDGRIDAELNLHQLRSKRARGPIVSGGGDGGALQSSVMEAAVCQALGWEAAQGEYPEKTLELAHKTFREQFGIQRLLLEEAWASGLERSTMKITRANCERILRYADRNKERVMMEGPEASGGFSTLGTTGILGNTANKRMKERFTNLDQTWRRIAGTGSTTDFKLVTRYRLLGMMEYEELGKGGEIQHAALAEESHTEKLKTYARMFALTREDLINDDLGAFDDITQAMALGAYFCFNTKFWTEWLDNATFFTTARGNKASSGGALASDTLTTAVTAFREAALPGHGADSGTHFLGMTPRYLLVPAPLESTADLLYTARNVYSGASGTSTADVLMNRNVHENKYQPIVSPYIGDVSGLSGGSDTAWYLLADPMQMACIKAIFLNGQQSPMVESADADFNMGGGIQFRGLLDFDCKKTEYRAGYMNAGA